jgi:hypothetical protein
MSARVCFTEKTEGKKTEKKGEKFSKKQIRPPRLCG